MKNKNIDKADGLNGLRLKPSTVSTVVALGISGSKKSKYVIKWALDNLIPEGDPGKVCFKLLHVFPQITIVPTPMGGGIPISQVRNDIVAAYRKEVEWQTTEKLLPYKILCIRKQVQVEIVQIESDDIPNVIAEQIRKYNINRLVIAASSNRMFSSSSWTSRGQNLSAKVSESCPTFCTVYVISKGKLSSVRSSDPKATVRTVEQTNYSSRFSDHTPNHSLMSLPEWIAQGSTSPNYLPRPSPPAKEFQSLPDMNQRPMDQRRNSGANRSLSYSIGQGEEDGNSCSSDSDFNDAKSKATCSRSLLPENHSWKTNQSSSVNASMDSSLGNQVDINYELEQLRMELRHITGMYARAQTEAINASHKLNDLHQKQSEENAKLQEISIKEKEAKELAEHEKARYEATKKEAEYAKECAEKEATLKADAEKKAIHDAKAKEKLESTLTRPGHHYQEFSWEEIMSGTSSFSNDLKVRMGSYGTVYKCTLRHTTAAVKILHSMTANRTKQFQQELEILSKIRHPNLMTLLGACSDHGCLVYEYMENGSLEEKLFRKSASPPIPWFDRFRIACEIASALTFLHNTKPKPIIHRDLNPANILLDQNFVSKIGDVGLSTMLHSDTFSDSMATLYKDTSPVGTLCYIDPEYQRTGLVSPKSDVYAFGMVVLQLITAKPALGLARTTEMAIGDDRLVGLLDPEAGDWPVEATKELAILALRCTELHSRDRPDLKIQILPALEKLRMVADKVRDLTFSGSMVLPDHFVCPILKAVMNDPCVAADGYTYDRKAIEEWLEKNDTSPVTNLPLLNKSLIPNYALSSAITEWKSGRL